MIKYHIILLVFALIPVTAADQAVPGDCGETVLVNQPVAVDDARLTLISQRLGQMHSMRAQFSQEKKLAALRRPLRSQGSFLFAGGKGVCWQTTTPFDTLFVITPEAIFQKSENARPIRVKAEEQPIIHGFTNVFLALFKGDTAALSEEFTLTFAGTDQDWTIGLKPKSMLVGKLIEAIVLRGQEYINQVCILETSGDRTLIHFDSVDFENLNSEELANFDF